MSNGSGSHLGGVAEDRTAGQFRSILRDGRPGPIDQVFVTTAGTVKRISIRRARRLPHSRIGAGIRPRGIRGGPISRLFTAIPELQKCLKGLVSQKTVRLRLGVEAIDAYLIPVSDQQGKRIGVFQGWDIVTNRLSADAEIAKTRAMLESLPINVIVANRDFDIVYINPASVRTLKSIERLLPVPVEKIWARRSTSFTSSPSISANRSSYPKKSAAPRENQARRRDSTTICSFRSLRRAGKLFGTMVTGKSSLRRSASSSTSANRSPR